MSLWHWIAGGAAAYYFLKKNKAEKAAEIVTYMDQRLGVTGTVVQQTGGYNMKTPDGTVSPTFPSLTELFAFAQTTYPAVPPPASGITTPADVITPAPPSPVSTINGW